MNNQYLIGEFQDPSDPNSRATGDVTALQLASIAYFAQPDNTGTTIRHYLPNWMIAWESDPNQVGCKGNYAFIAQDVVQYVLVIRGTIIDLNWDATAEIHTDISQMFHQDPWNFTMSDTKPMLSSSLNENLEAIINLRDKMTGKTIYEFLDNDIFGIVNNFCMIGHGLGGSLAAAYALWFRYQFEWNRRKLPDLFAVITFGALAEFNKDLADIFDQTFPNSWRYYNVLDAFPMIAYNVDAAKNLYPSPSVLPDAKQMEWIDAFNTKLNDSQASLNSYYTHVNQQRGSIALNDTNSVIYTVDGDNQFTQWMHQVAAQHDFNHYLDFLGGTEIERVTSPF